MKNLIEFKTKDQVSKEARKRELLHTLEGLMERAESGDLSGIAFATISNAGEVGTGWAGHGRVGLGLAVGVLFHRFMAAAQRRD